MLAWRVLSFSYNKKGRNISWNFADNSKRMLLCYAYASSIKGEIDVCDKYYVCIANNIINPRSNLFGAIWTSSLTDY